MNIDLDRELESNPEYRRILAELSPDERLRLLGTDLSLPNALEKKRDYRRRIAALPPADKLCLLEELRRRAELQKGSRQSATRRPPPPAPDTDSNSTSDRFGGRATASGVNYEVRIAAFLSVQMLCGSRCAVWSGVTGADVSAITMQAPEPVDDIVVNLRGDPEARVFISAKERGETIPLTPSSPAFADTVTAFVCQFLKLSPVGRTSSRLLWALPSSAGLPATQHLADVLDALRLDTGETAFSEFMRGRRSKEREAFRALLSEARRVWEERSGRPPTEDELRCFFNQVYVQVYEFEHGQRLELQAETCIRSHIAADPEQAMRIWEKLEHFFARVDQRGIRVTPSSLRRILVAEGIGLKSPPDYADDISRLRQLTAHNLHRLKEHSVLPFGAKADDAFHIPRQDELTALLGAAQHGHFLITGEPGCGKSGLVYLLVEALQKEAPPVVLLLAEDMTGGDWKGTANFPGLTHPLDEVLANWPGGTSGLLITDALDAVRDAETQKRIRNVLRDVKAGETGWKVIASVREFDLQHGRELRETFPGEGVPGYVSPRFPGVAHFHVPRLSKAQLDDLASKRPAIRLFLEKAGKTAKAEAIHSSPFYLRLAAELLNAGVTPSRLADWTSPALLLRQFWQTRIDQGAGAEERQAALSAICRGMVERQRMVVSVTELPLGVSERKAVFELRSRGIFQAPAISYGARVGEDEIRFTHHLLHDYAIAQSLIPKSPQLFCDYAIRQPLLPIFYRQSFLFALEELWDIDEHRAAFWESALRLEGAPKLHGLARILAPIIAARRVESLGDLQPLLDAIGSEHEASSPSHKALLHLASGLQDVDEDLIRSGARGWCGFVELLASMLQTRSVIEWPLVHILARLNAVDVAKDAPERVRLNTAGCRLLAHHVKQQVSKERQYPARIAVETVCRTFDTAPADSEQGLLALMAPDRLAYFPHHDLTDLASNLKYLGAQGDTIVRKLFEAAFAVEPEPGHYEDTGSAIMNLRFETRDQWHMVQHALAEYYNSRNGDNAALMTETACIAWNALVHRRSGRHREEEAVLATIQFRGTACLLIEDWSHISGRSFEYEGNRILSHFEGLLRQWAAASDMPRLNAALDRFAARNRTSLMWAVFMEAGAEYPAALGAILEGVLNEPVFLTHPDYVYGGTALLRALHKGGDATQRERLERLILDLPKNVRLRNGEERNPTPARVEHAQDRPLGALEEPNIVLATVRDLWHERQSTKPLPANPKPQGPQVISHTYSDRELLERRGVNLKEPGNEEMFRLREELRLFLNRDDKKVEPTAVERYWPVVQQCEQVLEAYATHQPEMAAELRGYLVSACEQIAVQAKWPKTNLRWGLVRRILLKGADDPVPRPAEDEDAKEDRWPSWGWPAPRLDAARGLPCLAYRLGHADAEIATALRRLCLDKSHPLRFNLAERLVALFEPAPDLMWQLMDTFIAHERKFSVLDSLLLAMDRLWVNAPEEVRPRLRQIADRAMESAPADNHIHEMLAHTHLFQFLRTGDPECEGFITRLIGECDSQRASGALGPQLHACRSGGWLTAGNDATPDPYADAVRARTWGFFRKLLAAAQAKLKQHREEWRNLHEQGQPKSDLLQAVRDGIDRAMLLVDGIAMQLYFASGAQEERNHKTEGQLAQVQLQCFWQDAAPLFHALADEPHPHTAHQIVQTLYHLLPCAPREVFMLAARSILCSSEQARFQYEPLAVGDVVKLIQRALADYSGLFHSEAGQESECLAALLEVLDRFVQAGWPEARQLTHRLEEIYR